MTPTVVPPTPGIDPRTALAASMHSAPGVYAVLAGSGLSRGAGLPTAWDVIEDLCRQAGRAEGAPDDELESDPTGWWQRTTGREAHYGELLDALAPTPAARQALLAGYFDPIASDGTQPVSGAHRALASLVADGRIRLVLTTNFDRLIERAIEAAGVPVQVISTEGALDGAVPLVHAPATVVKLHGDFADQRILNTDTELASYPPGWARLLERVLDEYGLITVGWSGQWDTALAETMVAAPNRRYPAYWVTRGPLTEPARRITDHRQATVITTPDADAFFDDLTERLARLDARARTVGRHRLSGEMRLMPGELTQAPAGWAVLPLLHLRAAASYRSAAVEHIYPAHRRQIETALATGALTPVLTDVFAASTPASADVQGSRRPTPPPIDGATWVMPDGTEQTTHQATYRLGGDALAGVSALLDLTGQARRNGWWTPTIEIGASIRGPVAMADAVRLLVAALTDLLTTLPDAAPDLFDPSDTTPVEIHIAAASTDGNSLNRPNSLAKRLDLASIGEPTIKLRDLMAASTTVEQPATTEDLTATVIDAVEFMLLGQGWTDPTEAVDAIRADLAR